MKFLFTLGFGKAWKAKKTYDFWASRAFPRSRANKNFIFSKSTPLNKNPIYRNFISIPFDPPLARFCLKKHRKIVYWFWNSQKLAVELKNGVWSFEKVKSSKWIKFSNTIFLVFEMFFGSHGMLRKQSEPIWMYIERFYKNKKIDFFSRNFHHFWSPTVICALRFPDRGKEFSSRRLNCSLEMMRKCRVHEFSKPQKSIIEEDIIIQYYLSLILRKNKTR